MPIGERSLRRLRERARDAEVDQPRRRAHHDVARLDVEVDDALGGHVVQRRGDVQRRAAGAARARACRRARSSSSSVGPSRCSSTRCGKRPSRTAPKPRTTTGWASARQQFRLALEVAQRGGVGRVIGPQDLRHEHREPVLVPDQHRLVAAAAADPAQHGAPGRELVALLQTPRRPRPALASHGGGAATVESLTRRPATPWSSARRPVGPSPRGTRAACRPRAATAASAAVTTRGSVRCVGQRVVVGEGEEGVGEGWRHRRRRGGRRRGVSSPLAPLDNPVSRNVNGY